MNKKLTDLQRLILLGVVADYRRLKRQQVPEWGPYNVPKEIIDLRKAKQAGAVVVDAERWTGMKITSDAQRMAVTRAYIALEKMGLIKRMNLSWSGTRCTHLAPTITAGVKLANELTKEISRAKAAARMRSAARNKAAIAAETGPATITAGERRRLAAEALAKRASDG